MRYMDPVGRERRGVDCGKPAASLFCQDKGFRTAAAFITSPYYRGATFTIGEGAVDGALDGEESGGRMELPRFTTIFTNITCTT